MSSEHDAAKAEDWVRLYGDRISYSQGRAWVRLFRVCEAESHVGAGVASVAVATIRASKPAGEIVDRYGLCEGCYRRQLNLLATAGVAPANWPEGRRAPDRRRDLEELGERLEEAMENVDRAVAPIVSWLGVRS